MKKEMRYNEAELGMIKSIFAENMDLAKALRKFFLEIELNDVEKAFFGQLKTPEAIKLLRKTFAPSIDGNEPLHQVIDLWMTVDIKGKQPEQVEYELKSRDIVLKYLDKKLDELENINNTYEVTFASLGYNSEESSEYNFTNLLTRNTIIGHVEMQLNQFLVLAGQKDETVEDTKKRLEQNSAK